MDKRVKELKQEIEMRVYIPDIEKMNKEQMYKGVTQQEMNKEQKLAT